jgi:hypothetical protein
VEGVSNGERALPVVAGDDGGYALHQVGVVAAAFWVGEIFEGVGVRIDESRGDDKAFCVERSGGFLSEVGPDEDDSIAADADVEVLRGGAGAVENGSVLDEKV